MSYKVDNAIIMAAGLSSRFAPLSYEKPKALIQVKGEVLIERQITQLREAGVKEIYIVTGYKAEQFAYLEDKFHVHLVHNPYYLERNNHYSLYVVKDVLKNSYICSADNYFSENPFESEVDDAYYAAIYADGKTNEWCMQVDGKDYIEDVKVGGENSWIMLGHVFFSEVFSRTFMDILENVIEEEATKGKLWESIYIENISKLKMKIRRYEESVIYEFDSLDELREFDETYVNTSGSAILASITKELGCQEKELTHIIPLKDEKGNAIGIAFEYQLSTYHYLYDTKKLRKMIYVEDVKKIEELKEKLFKDQSIKNITRLGGLTNHSYRVQFEKDAYVFRLPGEGTEELISRKNEEISTRVASSAGVDAQMLYFDEEGNKVTKFISNAVTMSPEAMRKEENIILAANSFRKLHSCNVNTEIPFDVIQMAEDYERFILSNNGTMYADFNEIREKVYGYFKQYPIKKEELVPCHNDPLCENWIRSDEKIYLIDWEYAGMNDPLWDVADLSIEADYSDEQDRLLLNTYFNHTYDETTYKRFLVNKIYIDYLWSLWGKTRVPFDSSMEEYAKQRYERMKANIKKVEK